MCVCVYDKMITYEYIYIYIYIQGLGFRVKAHEAKVEPAAISDFLAG